MRYSQVLSLSLLQILGWAAQSHAIYYIDDADSIVTYNSTSGTGYNKKWVHYAPDEGWNGLALNVDQKLLYKATG